MATTKTSPSGAGDEKIESVCRHCGNARMVPAKYIGKKVKCKACEQAYRIEAPSASEEEEPASPPPEAEAKAKVAPRKKPAKTANAAGMVRKYEDEVSPDDLLKDFKGRGVVTIAIVTLFLHVAILGGSSVGFIQEEFLSEHEELPEEDRQLLALDEATLAIKKISEKYLLTPDQITGMFSESGSRGDKLADKASSSTDPKSKEETKTPPVQETETLQPEEDAEEAGAEDKSDFQKKLEKVEDGPEEFTFEDEF